MYVNNLYYINVFYNFIDENTNAASEKNNECPPGSKGQKGPVGEPGMDGTDGINGKPGDGIPVNGPSENPYDTSNGLQSASNCGSCPPGPSGKITIIIKCYVLFF